MFFRIKSPSPILSWVISKNPESPPFSKSLSSSKENVRTVEGKFLNSQEYFICVKNDGINFLKVMRDENKDSYVSAERYLVCPYNLQGFSDIFRSALQGKNSAKANSGTAVGISDEEFNSLLDLEAEIGPFPIKSKTSVFENAGLNVEWILDLKTTEVGTLKLTTKEPSSITDFLRKIYIISMALTSSYNWNNTDLNKIDKFVSLGEGWLDTHPDRNYIVNKLSGNRKILKEHFTEILDSKEKTSVAANVREDPEKKLSLHTLRHQKICDLVAEICPKYGFRISDDDTIENDVDFETLNIIDLGSGEGKLLNGLLKIHPKIRIKALECVLYKIYKIRDYLRESQKEKNNRNSNHEQFELIHDNILYPRNIESLQNNQIVILSEVIEHFNTKDRQRLLTLIRDVLSPDNIIITTPNYEANIEIWEKNSSEGNSFKGFGSLGFRHSDHKIEYITEQFIREVVKFLEKKYNVEFIEFNNPDKPFKNQPSFIIKCSIKEKTDTPQIPKSLIRLHNSLYIPEIDLEISPKELHWGYTANGFVQNSNNIFWMGGTTAPCEFIPSQFENEHYLEHPQSVFDYYLNKGIKTLIEEPKWMGSRAYIAAFKNIETAQYFGFDNVIVINTRGGFTFFNTEEEKTIETKIYSEILDVLNCENIDFIMLDGEMLPWQYKGEGLIKDKFIKPGEAALIYRTKCGDSEKNILNSAEFLKEIANYTSSNDIKFHPFHLLAYGTIKKYNFVSQISHSQQLTLLHKFFNSSAEKIITCNVDGINIIDLQNKESIKNSITRWYQFTALGGEGFVYKTPNFTEYNSQGFPICPMMKCRGQNYLRIIYGIDYLEPEYFDVLIRNRNKNVKAKRNLSIQEHMIALNILRTTLNKNWVERFRNIAAFLGYDEFKHKSIDSTL